MKNIKHFLIAGLLLALSLGTRAQGYKLPAYEKFKLPNGLVFYLMEQHEVPLISVSAILPAGAIYDGEQSGLASLTAAGLKHGTRSMTKAKLDEELDFLGASVNTYASKESSGLSAKFAAKDKDKILTIIKEILLDPVFDSTEFTKEKKRLLVSLEQQKESPRSVIGAYFDKFLYGEHVYGNIVQGKISTVTALTTADLKKFYTANYRPDGSAISVAGDFNAKPDATEIHQGISEWLLASNLSPTIPVSAPKSTIDYIFCYPKQHWKKIEATTYNNITLSDHLPISSSIELEP